MIAIIAKVVGAKWAKPVFYGIIAVSLFVVIVGLATCNRDTTAERQAEQTTRSGDAYANSASNAIGVITNRQDAETSTDAATAAIQGNITNAQDPDAIRRAVLDGVCRKASHRNDPACTVR